MVPRAFVIVFLFGQLAGCASTPRITSDFDPSNDFSGYKTFYWADERKVVVPRQYPVSALGIQRLTDATENALVARGFKMAESAAAADFTVLVAVGAWNAFEQERVGGRRFLGQRTVQHTEGALGIDIFDGDSGRPVWNGRATKRLSKDDLDAPVSEIEAGILQVLSEFPPDAAPAP